MTSKRSRRFGLFISDLESEGSTAGCTRGGFLFGGLGLGPWPFEFRLRGPGRLAWELAPIYSAWSWLLYSGARHPFTARLSFSWGRCGCASQHKVFCNTTSLSDRPLFNSLFAATNTEFALVTSDTVSRPLPEHSTTQTSHNNPDVCRSHCNGTSSLLSERHSAARNTWTCGLMTRHAPSGIHSKPVPLYLAVSLALGACTRQWAQFWVGLAAWGMEARKESLAIKKFHPGHYNGQILRGTVSFAIFGTPNGSVSANVWSANLKTSTQWQSHKRPEVDI